MAYTDSLKRQHDEILKSATELSQLLFPERLNGSEAIKILSQLSGKLSAHLAMEDKVLYPKLYQHDNPAIRQTARSFFNEMGGLSEAFRDYCNKWQDNIDIDSKPIDFIEDTKALFNILGQRIHKEDNILYPMADH
ncbi:MAG: hemerythrin domain-containing protein [Candidatus Caenarcaniphilales bacterium]|jgi:hemerythrin-like domain-containing protein|nr:hemerythrin domain-containing protein [Candidatus Caenarcaniphilales bacterium]